MLTHRSFQAPKPLEYAFAVLGSMAVQGPVMSWVADHRKHHAHADEEGDPHSPHVGHGDGAVRRPARPLARAHGLAVLDPGPRERPPVRARTSTRTAGMRLINRRFPLLVLLSLAIPALAGWALTGTLAGAATGLLWGGLVRIFLVHHITWSVNSVCHFLGTRRFETDDHSTNVAWLALPSFGESWHHNHHAFPRSASHGLRRWERLLDPSALVITMLEKLGLARNVVRIAPGAPARARAPGPPGARAGAELGSREAHESPRSSRARSGSR